MTENARGDPDTDSRKNQTLRNGNERHVAPAGNDYAKGNPGGGAPEGNTNAVTHGATATPRNLISDLPDEQLEYVEAIADGYLAVAPFDQDDVRYERLYMCAVRILMEWRGQQTILKDGISDETVIGINDRGEPITDTDEHYLAKFTSRLSKDVRLTLKDLDCLPDPDSQQAEATESLASVLAGEDR